jgi:hypothetical protein
MSDQACFTVGEVSNLIRLSPQTIRRLFENEPGIIILSRPERLHKRRYRVIRIPRNVYQRVIGKLLSSPCAHDKAVQTVLS